MGESIRDAAEHHLEVSRTARYWTLGDPSQAREVWFVLHGYMQLARRFLRRFEVLADDTRSIVAPESLSRFYVSPEPGRHGAQSVVGGSWMTREDRLHEIDDYVAYLDRVADAALAPDESVTVLGFSQGAATAARWVTYGTIRPARLVLWAGFMPPDLDLERAGAALANTDLVSVRGRKDRALTEDLIEQERASLAGAGIGHRTLWYDGGHEIDLETLRLIASG